MLTEESRLRDFPSLTNRVYLNSAAEGIPPAQVLDALVQYGQDKLLGMDGRLLHQEQWSQARERTARLLGFRTEDIAICSCSSEAYNLALLALKLKDGDEVVINDLDFPAGATPWLSESSPATVKVWRHKNGVLDVKDLEALLSSKTRLVNTSLVSFYNGFAIDVDEISEIVHKKSNALLAVDVTQALARTPLNLKNADLVVSSTHKWLLGPHGGGLIAVNPERADQLTATAGGWFNLENAFDETRFDSLRTKSGAGSFMVGMPNYAAIYAINAALNYMEGIGVSAINDHANTLVTIAREGIAELPVELLGPTNPVRTSGIISFKHPDFEKINASLHDKNIHLMAHAGRMRVAIHGYNNQSDVEAMLTALKEAIPA